MEENILEIQDLSKKFGKKLVLNKLNLKIKKGEIYGLVGNNGCGKTTLLKIISGLLNPSSGEIISEDKNFRKKIGTLIEAPAFYGEMSALDNLIAKQLLLYGKANKPKLINLLETVGLANIKQKVRTYSMGMKQRLGVALALVGSPEILVLDEPLALVGSPEILVLDEPLNNLDPQGINELRELILKLKENGTTIIISSHILDELVKVSTHYWILHNSEMIFNDTAQELMKAKGDMTIEDYYLSLLV